LLTQVGRSWPAQESEGVFEAHVFNTNFRYSNNSYAEYTKDAAVLKLTYFYTEMHRGFAEKIQF
jgi:hypothetical protein